MLWFMLWGGSRYKKKYTVIFVMPDEEFELELRAQLRAVKNEWIADYVRAGVMQGRKDPQDMLVGIVADLERGLSWAEIREAHQPPAPKRRRLDGEKTAAENLFDRIEQVHSRADSGWSLHMRHYGGEIRAEVRQRATEAVTAKRRAAARRERRRGKTAQGPKGGRRPKQGPGRGKRMP